MLKYFDQLVPFMQEQDSKAHLPSVDARGGCGLVLVVTLRRMTEMDDEIAIV